MIVTNLSHVSVSVLFNEIIDSSLTTGIKYHIVKEFDKTEVKVEYLRLDAGFYFLTLSINSQNQFTIVQDNLLRNVWTTLYIVDGNFGSNNLNLGLLTLNHNDERNLRFYKDGINKFHIILIKNSSPILTTLSFFNCAEKYWFINGSKFLAESKLLEIKKWSSPKIGVIKTKNLILNFLSQIRNPKIETDLKQRVRYYCEQAFTQKVELVFFIANQYGIEASKINCLFLELFKVCVADFYRNFRVTKLEAFIKSDEDFLHKYFLKHLQADTWPIVALGLEFNLSRSHINPFFTKILGTNEDEYVRKLRSKHIKICKIENPRIKVRQLTKDLGFRNINSLIRFFKKYDGVSPGKYLKR